jgi:hypothetical protein
MQAGYFDTLFKGAALLLSNTSTIGYILTMCDVGVLQLDSRRKDPLNDDPACKQKVNELLETYNGKDIKIFDNLNILSDSTNEFIDAKTYGKKIFINKVAAQSLKNQNSPVTADIPHAIDTTIGHEIKHSTARDMEKITAGYLINCAVSTFAINKIFTKIWSSNKSIPLKVVSITSIALGKFVFDQAVSGAYYRSRENAADDHAIKYAKNPVALKQFAQQYKQFETKFPRTAWESLIDTHPPIQQRIKKFEDASIKLELLKKSLD